MAEGGRNKRKNAAAAAAAIEEESEPIVDATLSLPHDAFIQQYALVVRKEDGSVTVLIKSTHKAIKNVLAAVMGNYNPVNSQPSRSVRYSTFSSVRDFELR